MRRSIVQRRRRVPTPRAATRRRQQAAVPDARRVPGVEAAAAEAAAETSRARTSRLPCRRPEASNRVANMRPDPYENVQKIDDVLMANS
jgi:hypothetical protein